MFTNQKLLGVVLILLIIGAGTYFAVTKFKQEVTNVTSSPSPSPSPLEFVLNLSTPTPQPTQEPIAKAVPQVTPKPTPKPSELPLSKNKRLPQFPGILSTEVLQNKKVVIQMSKGVIEIEIYPDVPQTASNFLILASNGFYDGLTFHRVESGFVVQGGDPLGNGTGNPGYTFADELVGKDYMKGIVAMANAGPNTNGSQFFIMLSDHPELPKNYTIFGKVISGMDVVEKIVVGDVMQKVTIENMK